MLDEVLDPVERAAIERRRFIKGAITVAWAAPVIVTAMASPAFANHVLLRGTCNTTTFHCVATAGGFPVVCCAAGTANAGKCGYASGTGPAGSACVPADCCSGACATSGPPAGRVCT
jgi:hypothetical protein